MNNIYIYCIYLVYYYSNLKIKILKSTRTIALQFASL